jgi:hypothetical protein
MRITAAGNVGIGTTSPGYSLHISRSSTQPSIIGTNTNATTAMRVGHGYDVSSPNNITAKIEFTPSALVGYYGDDITFSTTTPVTSPSITDASTERMRITSTGDVGIGTSTPDTKIHAVNDFYCFLKAEVPSYGYMQMGSSGGYGIISTNNSQSIKINTDGDLVIFAGGSFSERARFTAIGLGIGDPSYNTPEYTLDVTGTGRFKSGSFISGSLNITGSQVITGSLRGQVSALSIASNTASVDMSSNNFFTLALVNGANTHINPTNLQPGQTVNIRVTQGSLGTGTVSFPSFVDQASGSLYTGSMVSNAIDIVTMITFDSTTVFMSSVRNMI